MRTRTWATFILVNIIVSAAVMLTVLVVWNRVNTSPPPTPSPLPPSITVETTGGPPTAVPVVSPTPSGPLTYTVQAGDTMSAIARAYSITVEDLMTANELTDPNVLHVGQTLTIPTLPRGSAPTIEATTEPSPTASSSATLPPTLTPSGPALVEIGQVLGSSDLETEVVVLRNRGGAASLEGWSLSDAEGNIFTFPALTLFTDTQLRVHSITGRSTPSDLYWGREKPAWNGGELITLRDSDGDVVDTYIVP